MITSQLFILHWISLYMFEKANKRNTKKNVVEKCFYRTFAMINCCGLHCFLVFCNDGLSRLLLLVAFESKLFLWLHQILQFLKLGLVFLEKKTLKGLNWNVCSYCRTRAQKLELVIKSDVKSDKRTRNLTKYTWCITIRVLNDWWQWSLIYIYTIVIISRHFNWT